MIEPVKFDILNLLKSKQEILIGYGLIKVVFLFFTYGELREEDGRGPLICK